MLLRMAVALCAVAGSASAASAYGFEPESAVLYGSGELFVGPLACPATGVRLLTDAEGGASVTGVNPVRCPKVVFSGLPWRMVARTETKGFAHKAAWTAPTGPCGPLLLKLAVSHGLVTFAGGTGACAQTLTITTTPALEIDP